jgi:hypothetical protein
MPPGKGWMSCSLKEPGASAGVASGCGSMSQTEVMAISWTRRISVRDTWLPSDQSSGSIA